MNEAIDPKIIDRIRKVLAVGGNTPSEAEANTALALAHKLLAKYNLDLADVQGTEEPDEESGGVRIEGTFKGGRYSYQQRIWGAVSELNFCSYFIQSYHEDTWLNPKWIGKRQRWKLQKRHLIIGREHNIKATEAMAGYLEQTLERLLRDSLVEHDLSPGHDLFSNWAMSWREGCCDRLRGRILERIERLRRGTPQPGEDTNQSTALVLSNFFKREADANDTYVKAKYKIGKARKAGAKDLNHGAYYEGYDQGGGIGLDPQIGSPKPKGHITG